MDKIIFKGEIRTAHLCKPISEVKIQLLDVEGTILSESSSDQNGKWEIQEVESSVYIRFSKNGFSDKELKLSQPVPEVIRLLESNIIGYLNKLGYHPGEEISAFIHSPEEFEAEIVHYGFKISQIQKLGTFPASIQNVPDGFFVDSGLEWNETFKIKLPEKLPSGFYGLRIYGKKSHESFNITFVLQPSLEDKTDHKDVLLLASSNNWQTYNIWGGRSRYRNFENPVSSGFKNKLRVLGIRFTPESLKSLTKRIFRNKIVVSINDNPEAIQFKKLSVKRPHPNCSINDDDPTRKFTSHLAPGEWRVAAWLERENIQYDVITGFYLHNFPDLLRKYKVFMLSTHCEYWSKEMYNALVDFNKNGGTVMNLSGNSIYREVEFYEDGSLHCTSLRFSETVCDESELIGVRFDMRGYGTCAPYKVINPSHWVFKGTNVKKNQLFAKESLNSPEGADYQNFNEDPSSSPGMAHLTGEGGSGWETDKITATAPEDVVLLAKGMNKRRGGADMIVREGHGHGIVFSASSITFGGSLLIDPVSSQITKNVIEKSINSVSGKFTE